MTDNSNQFLDALKEMQGVEVGNIVNVEVLSVEDGQIAVGVENAGVEGVITKREFTNDRNADLNQLVKPGDKFEALVLRRAGGDKENGEFFFSVTRLKEREAYKELEKVFEEGKTVEGTVTGAVRGGLLVDVGTRGFLPASLISNRYVSDLKPYIGKKMNLKITEIDPNKNRLILSRKDLIEQEREEAFENVASQLVVGDTVEGKVSRLTGFGAFVDVGGVDGLVHISEISYKHVDKPSDVLKAGQDVKVKVLSVDPERERISLSIKQTLPGPWDDIEEKAPVDSVLTGTVKRLTSFGAFVEVFPGVEGLVHISQISHKHIATPADVLKPGQEVQVKVISVDPEHQRLGLSMKALEERPKEDENNNNNGENYRGRRRSRRNNNNRSFMNNAPEEESGFSMGDLIGDKLKDLRN